MARTVHFKKRLEDDRGVRHKPKPLRSAGSMVPSIRRMLRFDMTHTSGTPQQRSARFARWILWQDTQSPRANFTRIAVMIIAGLCMGFMSNIEILWGSWRDALVFPVLASFFACPSYFLLFYYAGLMMIRQKRKEILVLPNTCVACIFDMSGLAAEHDGCTVCPECGAAWRFPIRGPWAKDG